MQPINKHSVMKQVRQTGSWMGYIAPSKVNSHHINDNWHIGSTILVSIGRDNEFYAVSPYQLDFCNLDGYLNNYKYYNCNSELGYGVKFWN